MAIRVVQLTLTGSTATATIVKGTASSGNTLFTNAFGTIQDPIPVSIKNEDGAATVYWGGSNVDSTHGQSIPPLGSIQMNLYGDSEVPYVWSTGTPVVSVALGRQ